MPGLTLMLSAAENLLDRQAFAVAQELMIHDAGYQAHRRFSGGLGLGHVAYPEYPFRTFDAGRVWVALEGRIYSQSWEQAEQELRRLAEVLAAQADPERLAGEARGWLDRTDGEFVAVLALPQQGRAAVLSDAMGRLPLFYYADDQQLIVSRECKFIHRLKPNPQYDPVGCAQVIWMRYPIGQRTPYKDIRRAGSGFFIHAAAEGGRLRSTVGELISFNFEHKPPMRSQQEEAQRVAQLFVEACRGRGAHPEVTTNVLSLSGGQDARASGAGLYRAGVRFVAATHTMKSGTGRECELAKKISHTLGAPWQLFEIPKTRLEDRAQLAWMKDGLNYTGMGFILPYLRWIVGNWGRGAVYVTGDGGDRVMLDLRLGVRTGSLNQLVEQVVRQHADCPVGLAAGLAGCEAQAVLDDLRALLASYPEQDLAQKLVHFGIFEYGRRWGFEGEDRARFFLWQTSPFYGLDFFRACMGLPDRIKRDYRFYRRVLYALSPELAAIPDASTGLPTRSWLYPYKRGILLRGAHLPRWLKAPIRRIIKGPRPPLRISQDLHGTLDRAASATLRGGTPLDPAHLREFLSAPDRWNAHPITVHSIHTLALLEEGWRARSLAGCSVPAV